MNEYIKQYYDGKISLTTLISKLGINNTIFEISMDRSKKPKFFIICDKSISKRYDKDYKIYLLSTDLEETESYYITDLDHILLHQEDFLVKINVHYRIDLVNSKIFKK